MHINSLESIYKLITCDTMIEILRKTSKLTIIMWTFLAQDYFIQMSIHKFSKHLLLWVSLVWSVSRLAWEASCLLISQMTTGRGWVLMRWPGRGCKTPATWRHSPRSGGSCSSTELLLKQDVYIFENRRMIFATWRAIFARKLWRDTVWVMRASARHITLIYCLR